MFKRAALLLTLWHLTLSQFSTWWWFAAIVSPVLVFFRQQATYKWVCNFRKTVDLLLTELPDKRQ